MTPFNALVRRVALGVCACGTAAIVHAQTVAQAPAADTAARPENDEPIELSPFVVNASDDRGYQAQHSLSGSRLKTPLKDIATPVSVFTEQFFLDTGITDTNELTKYLLNTELNFNENAGSTGTNQNLLNGNARPVRVRGLGGGSLTTNFFNTGGVADTFSSERIEQARGPNAILFGIGNPGGLVNTTTKRARLDRNASVIGASIRSYDGTRVEFDHNQVVVDDKLAVRVAGVQSKYGDWRVHDFRDVDGYFGTFKWQITPSIELNFEGERTHVTKHTSRTFTAIDGYTAWRDAGRVVTTTDNPNTAAGIVRISGNPWIVFDELSGTLANWRNKNQGATKVVAGGADNPVLTDFSVLPPESSFYGPGYDQNIDYSRLSTYLTYSKNNLNVEFAAMRYSEHRFLWDPQQNISWFLRADPNAFLPGPGNVANPNVGKAYFESQAQIDRADERTDYLRATVNYTFDLGRWFGRHTIGGVAERDTFRSDRESLREYVVSSNAPVVLAPTVSAASNVGNRVFRRTYIDLNAPADARVSANPTLRSTSGLVERVSGQTYQTAFIPHDANTRILSNATTSYIGMLQSSFWDDRIKTVAGVSRDERAAYQSSQIILPNTGGNGGIASPIPGSDAFEESADNFSFNGVFRATKWLNLTYSRARNSGLAPNSGLLHSATGRPPAAKGNSEDYGIRLSLLDDRIYVSALRYETSSDDDFQTGTIVPSPTVNVVWEALNAAGVRNANGQVVASNTENSNGSTFSSASEGYELELTANLTRNWRVFLNYAYAEIEQTNIAPEMIEYLDQIRPFWLEGDRGRLLLDGSGLAPTARDNDNIVETVAEQVDLIDSIVRDNKTLAEGRRPMGQVKHKFNVRTNYDFTSGVLNGVNIGAAAQYRSSPVIGYEANLDSAGNLLREITEGSEQIFFDANIGYRNQIRLFDRRISYSVQLNVDNILDNDAYMTTRVNSAGSVTSYRFNTGRTWILSTRFAF